VSTAASADPIRSRVEATVRDGGFDEIVVSTLLKKTWRWLRRDLFRRVELLGLPVTTIVPGARALTEEEIVEYVGRFGQPPPALSRPCHLLSEHSLPPSWKRHTRATGSRRSAQTRHGLRAIYAVRGARSSAVMRAPIRMLAAPHGLGRRLERHACKIAGGDHEE
jgi:hypothetical protein